MVLETEERSMEAAHTLRLRSTKAGLTGCSSMSPSQKGLSPIHRKGARFATRFNGFFPNVYKFTSMTACSMLVGIW